MHSLRLLVKGLIFSRNMSFYAVASGRKRGIYDSWSKCEDQVKGYKGAKYKKFPTQQAAEEFMSTNDGQRNPNYKPRDNLVALGKKECKANCTKIDENNKKQKNTDDYWPDCDGDGDNLELGDKDLLSIFHEVEGLTAESSCSKAAKRKLPPKTTSSRSKIPKHESKIWEPVAVKKIGAHEFQIDSEDFVICYTDGSCFNNGQKNASAGFGVYFDDDHPLNAGKAVRGRVTNNAGEIQAAIHAIKIAKSHGIEKLCVSTDSQFLINAITLWINAWKRKDWCLKNGDPVKNVDDFKELDSLLRDGSIMVKWNYVKGHKGIKGNEMADKLARQGTEIYKRMHLN